MPIIAELLSLLDRQQVLQAIHRLDEGTLTRFADSTAFDLLYQGKRYAPKAVAGLALEIAYQREFRPSDFKGGEGSSAFLALRRCGFTIIPKMERNLTTSLTTTIADILRLQTQYSSENSKPMQERGVLVRTIFRDILYSRMEQFEPLFSEKGYECMVEGRDGIGRKTISPWIRLYDPKMSPSATQGWYIVIHFSSKGDVFYLTIGCGSTIIKGSAIIHVDSDVLKEKIKWAKSCFAKKPRESRSFSNKIELHGNNLSDQFEKATAFAKRYPIQSFNESEFWQDLQTLCGMLVTIYEAERLGKSPHSESPEAYEHQFQLAETIRPRKSASPGQGRFLKQAEKKAVELHAMEAVRTALPDHGFTDIHDTSAKESYDFSARKDGNDWFIEVKGTTSAKADSFLLTANELTLHRQHQGRTVLAIVYDIDLDHSADTPKASGGMLSLSIPWDPEQWDFIPTVYSASKKIAN
ncbi:MrcB family domain-containing protein [Chromobacterium sp. ATCC 53434]|uniref:MrcB family domain-containing protein n=1 Tax=Chromobacterium sp. (strain ATCC 53434 / SC 14030) TaxID=2059672 RepID=UPI0013053A05|nr:DUF3578 domain-containing protein [Chromobacterium sp. ATCC 53434]